MDKYKNKSSIKDSLGKIIQLVLMKLKEFLMKLKNQKLEMFL